MNRILSSIRKAKNEDKVKGIYLETGILETDYATLQEIRNALADFKKSGKWIIAYGDALCWHPTFCLRCMFQYSFCICLPSLP